MEGKSGDDQNDEGEGVYGSKNFVKSKKTKTLKQETFREQGHCLLVIIHYGIYTDPSVILIGWVGWGV